MCDTHFAYTLAARTRDEDEGNAERAIGQDEPITGVEKGGESVRGQRDLPDEKKEENVIDKKRSSTTDNVNIEESSPKEVDAVHSDLQKLSTTWKKRDRAKFTPTGRSNRSESEVREARDHVSELVSRVSATGESYSSMSSGKTALSRLARQDSARWSDRFFEGSDDGDEDDDDDGLLQEIRRAQNRGELNQKFHSEFDVESAPSDSEASKTPMAKIADRPLTESPGSTRLSKQRKGKENENAEGHMITAPYEPLSAEPGELEPLSHSSAGTRTPTPQATSGAEAGLNLEPGSITALSTGPRLGLSLGEDIDERQRREIGAGGVGDAGGVVEQVVQATTKNDEKEKADS
jgi:hypothetical protein